MSLDCMWPLISNREYDVSSSLDVMALLMGGKHLPLWRRGRILLAFVQNMSLKGIISKFITFAS